VRVYTTTNVDDLATIGATFARLEATGYDGAFTFEAKHDPFVPLAVAAGTTDHLALGTAVAIAFARNPMILANVGYDLQVVSGGRFVLGLGSQIRPHIVNRYSSPWSRPAARMRDLVSAIHAIWHAWETGEPLRYEGDFYRHTLMTPTFDPGPNPHGPPPVFVGGFGPRMVEITGEVADGLFVHPFNTRRSLLERTIPDLERGLTRAGRTRDDCDVIVATLVVTASSEEEFERVRAAARGQLAFYGSTPAYRPTLDCHGWGDLQPELNRLSKEGRWADMSSLIDDELLEAIAVVGEPDTIAPQLVTRLDGISDAVSITHNRAPDPDHWAPVVEALHNDD
jgi:probable F420-dependent oxidoreductase